MESSRGYSTQPFWKEKKKKKTAEYSTGTKKADESELEKSKHNLLDPKVQALTASKTDFKGYRSACKETTSIYVYVCIYIYIHFQ